MSRPVYTAETDVLARMPLSLFTECLDDDGDGLRDAAVWLAVAEDAARTVDGYLGQRYAVPFDPANAPATVFQASLLFVLETLYLRRGKGTEETNPWLVPARAMRRKLEAIGTGEQALTPASIKPRPSVATFTEPARTSSRHGHTSF